MDSRQPSVKCSACGHENPESAQFCLRCHAPLRFTCPACHHAQDHGGQCDRCGVDFLKYASALAFAGINNLQQARTSKKHRTEIFNQIFLLPITGGWSLLKLLRRRGGGD